MGSLALLLSGSETLGRDYLVSLNFSFLYNDDDNMSLTGKNVYEWLNALSDPSSLLKSYIVMINIRYVHLCQNTHIE